MALFGKKRSPVVVDDLLQYTPAHAAAEAASRADVGAVRAALAAPSATGDPRNLVVEGIARHMPLGAAVAWTDAEPEAPDAWLVRAATEAYVASEARGKGMAEDLSTGQILDFEQLMADATRSATRAAELGPDDPEPIDVLIRTCYARRTEQLGEYLDELRRRDPWHLHGLMTVVNLLGEKWYGRPREARTLADELAATAPDGSLVPMFVADAIREQWLYYSAFENNRKAAVGFMTSAETGAALDAALAKSLHSPAYRPTPLEPLARNVFAFSYHLRDQHDVVAALLTPLGGLATEFPWAILGNTPAIYSKALRA